MSANENSIVMEYIEVLNFDITGYDGDLISGEKRWGEDLQAYEISHCGEVTTVHSLRSKWSRAKSAMVKLI